MKSSDGEYYLSAWVMNTAIVEKNDGLSLLIDGDEKISGKLKPLKESWQCTKLLDTQDNAIKIKLTAGIHDVCFCSNIPEFPNVEFVRLSKSENNIEISEKQWNKYFEEAKNNELPENYAELKEGSLKKILPNPRGDYLHDIDAYFTYSYATTFYFSSGTNVTFETKSSNPCANDPKMYLFNASNPESNGSWGDNDGGDCYQSKITCTIQNSGTYWLLVRSSISNGSQTTNLYLNDNLYASNIVISGANYSCYYLPSEVINYFTYTNNLAQGDPKLWIESDDVSGKILAFNDDYSGSGDFIWQQNDRVKKLFSSDVRNCILTSSSTYYSTGYCDLYMQCGSSYSALSYFFPNLEADDATRSGNASSGYYNCISWSGGITTNWEWPLNSGSDYNVPGNDLASFDCYYGNVDQYGNKCVRDVYPNTRSWNYTRSGATSSNNQIDLWSKDGNYTHASIKANWSNLTLENPANDNPHGYCWESKPGPQMRTFHARNSLSGTGDAYGNIDKYYRTNGTYETLPLNKLSAAKNIALTEAENSKLEELIAKIDRNVIVSLDNKYDNWKETWKGIVQSDPREFAKTNEYQELFDFCKNEGNLLPILVRKFNNGDFFVINLIEDLTYANNKDLMNEVKKENRILGVSKSLKENWMSYTKKMINANKLVVELSEYNKEILDTISTLPKEFCLEQNYPNPFNPNTQIKYSLPSRAKVSLKIYDILGKEIKVLIDNEIQSAGHYTANWNSTDNYSNHVSSGIYFCRIQVDKNIKTIKLLLVK